MVESREPVRFLSLGWGVQSWTLAAMMALDELPRVDHLVHADTGHEAEATYAFAKAMTPWLGEHGMSVVTVQAKRTQVVREDWSDSVLIPAFTLDGSGSEGQVRRQCTHDWKIAPIRTFLRAELRRLGRKVAPGAVEAWLGISADEWHRMRTSDVAYITNVYPLVDRRMTRKACMRWLATQGLPTPPKSACTFCPYHGLAAWRDLKRTGGPDWQEAVEVDLAIRSKRPPHDLFAHPYRRPLEDAVRLPEDDGQLALGLALEEPCDSGYCFA